MEQQVVRQAEEKVFLLPPDKTLASTSSETRRAQDTALERCWWSQQLFRVAQSSLWSRDEHNTDLVFLCSIFNDTQPQGIGTVQAMAAPRLLALGQHEPL